MLNTLTDKLRDVFSKLAGKSTLTEDNISDAANEVRLALLEADVNYSVAKTLVKQIKEKAVGTAVTKSVSPSQQFIKVVHDELIALMGGDEASLELKKKPAVIMVCGLQGSGKTTHCAKLARYLMKHHLCSKPLLAACDLQRPAAIDQLQTLAAQISVPVVVVPGEKDPLVVAKTALQKAKNEQFDVLIVDTAGRLHIDDELMSQLERLRDLLNPSEVLLVANATLGQDAVNVAAEFNKRIAITGSILTMLDGNTRGGAAISIREVTGKPLKFEGVGEKIEDIQIFNPASMADRILGMGDTINLVKKAQEHISEADAKDLEKKIRSSSFSYNDYLSQISMVKKMGSLKSLMNMLPGMSAMKNFEIDDKQLFKIEAMILSMTEEERAEKCELIPSRRRRISNGSGTSLDDINKLIKSFKQAKQFFKNMPNMKQMQKMMGGGSLWR
jgi:signal recognition particle subunit SRP54